MTVISAAPISLAAKVNSPVRKPPRTPAVFIFDLIVCRSAALVSGSDAENREARPPVARRRNAVKSVAPVTVTNCGQVGVGVKPHFA